MKFNKSREEDKEKHTKAHQNQTATYPSEWLVFKIKISVDEDVKQLTLSRTFWWGCKWPSHSVKHWAVSDKAKYTPTIRPGNLTYSSVFIQDK